MWKWVEGARLCKQLSVLLAPRHLPPAAYVDWLATNPDGNLTFPAWRASRAAGRFQYSEVRLSRVMSAESVERRQTA